jgi:hypothetical protein
MVAIFRAKVRRAISGRMPLVKTLLQKGRPFILRLRPLTWVQAAQTNQRFSSGEFLCAYLEEYAPLREGEPQATVEVQIRIVDLNSGILISDPDPISATPYLKAGSPSIPIGRGIDISKVPKGSYRLEVQATDSNGKRTDSRFVNFSVQ